MSSFSSYRAHPPFLSRAQIAQSLSGRLPAPGERIGILGGSFHPPHPGHISVSAQARKRLALSEVWWCITPANPLKDARPPAPSVRLRQAKALSLPPFIRPSILESLLPQGRSHTAFTIHCLQMWFPRTRFVWLMGADNLRQIHLWEHWRRIFLRIPIAVLDRKGSGLLSRSAKAARVFGKSRMSLKSPARLQLPAGLEKSKLFALQTPPCWTFVSMPWDPHSSTALRKAQKLARKA